MKRNLLFILVLSITLIGCAASVGKIEPNLYITNSPQTNSSVTLHLITQDVINARRRGFGTMVGGVMHMPPAEETKGHNYGADQQKEFIILLKDVLVQNKTFKSVRIDPASPSEIAKINNNRAQITINFIKTIHHGGDGNEMTIFASLKIDDKNGPAIKKAYHIKPEKGMRAYWMNTLEDARKYATDKLMKSVVSDITQWASSIKNN